MEFDEKGRAITSSYLLERRKEETEEEIRRDFVEICNYLKMPLELRPKLVLDFNRSKVYYRKSANIVFLGLRRGYARKVLIHELLHAKGLPHKKGFRSHESQDLISPRLELKIFKGKAKEE